VLGEAAVEVVLRGGRFAAVAKELSEEKGKAE
jgi:hypothetical protein